MAEFSTLYVVIIKFSQICDVNDVKQRFMDIFSWNVIIDGIILKKYLNLRVNSFRVVTYWVLLYRRNSIFFTQNSVSEERKILFGNLGNSTKIYNSEMCSRKLEPKICRHLVNQITENKTGWEWEKEIRHKAQTFNSNPRSESTERRNTKNVIGQPN